MQSSSAIKVIIILGIMSFVFLMLFASSFRKSLEPDERERVTLLETPRSLFDGQRALSHLEHLAGLGSRAPGSAGAQAQRDYIGAKLRGQGIETKQFTTPLEVGGTAVSARHIQGIIPGSRSGVIALAAHMDTPPDAPEGFVGANQSAAGAAWLLEFALTMAPRRDGRTLWLFWLDGGAIAPEGAPAGPAALAAALKQQGLFEAIACLVLVGRMGDCYLRCFQDPEAPPWFNAVVWETAARMNYGYHFPRRAVPSKRPPNAFREAGLPVLEVVDAALGGTVAQHNSLWLTTDDDLSRVCRASLQAAGDVLYHALPAMDARLDREGAQ